MRTLCLKFSRSPVSSSQAELFLSLSPFLNFRGPWLFMEVASTSHLQGGEEKLVQRALEIADSSGLSHERWALTNSPSVAQALCEYAPFQIVSALEEKEALKGLPLEALLSLEGLDAWTELSPLRGCVEFFYALGFHQLGQILDVSAENFQWRWGKIGQTLWRRLHQKEEQKFAFFIPQSPLRDYAHLDHSLESLPLILIELRKILQRLILRMEARGLWAWRWNFVLHCEFSKAQHKISVQPSSPHRSLNLALTLLEHKLASIDLSNPLAQIEVDLDTSPEKITQLDFFEPRTQEHEERLGALVSLLKQEGIGAGFFQTLEEILPENSFTLSLDRTLTPPETSCWVYEDGALRHLPRHSEALKRSPRPSRFLKEPEPLSEAQMRTFQLLSSLPLERLEKPWWKSSSESAARDYYVAYSSKGQRLWIFQDTQTHGYYLHGYFD